MGVAKDNGYEGVIYNMDVYNAKPKKVIEYLKRKFNPDEEKIQLVKQNSKNGLISTNIQKTIEEYKIMVQEYEKSNWESEREHEFQLDKLEELKSEISSNLYLESDIKTHLIEDDSLEIQVRGKVNGLIFSVPNSS